MSNNTDKEENKVCLAVGGQALIEGVMMRGTNEIGIAVRKLDGEIVTKVDPINSKIKKYKIDKIPFIRGIFSFGSSLIIGTKALMFSAKLFDVEETEEEKAKREKKGKEKQEQVPDWIIWFSVIFGLLLSIGLFIIIPNLISTFIVPEENVVLYNVLETIFKFGIFLGYLILVSQMEDIKRVAEKYLELTVENVKKQPRFHPRCGTNFTIIVLIISVIIFTMIGRYENILINIGYRIVLLPIIAGVSYEVIRMLGRTQNKYLKVLGKPGLWLQRITTREPDDSQIEVAIEALKLAVGEKKAEAK